MYHCTRLSCGFLPSLVRDQGPANLFRAFSPPLALTPYLRDLSPYHPAPSHSFIRRCRYITIRHVDPTHLNRHHIPVGLYHGDLSYLTFPFFSKALFELQYNSHVYRDDLHAEENLLSSPLHAGE